MVNNNNSLFVFCLEDPIHVFTDQKRKKYIGPTCRKHWHDHRQMEYAKYNKMTSYIRFSIILTVCSQSGKVSVGWWNLNYGEGTSQRWYNLLEGGASTVAIAQETEKHKPDQHLTHSTSVMSYSETWAFKHSLHTSPLFLHTLLVARICMLCVITTERCICLKFVTKAFRCLNV